MHEDRPDAICRRSPLMPDRSRRRRASKRAPLLIRTLSKFTAATSGQLFEELGLSINAGNKFLRRSFDQDIVRRHAPPLTNYASWSGQLIYTLGPASARWIAEWEGIPISEARKRCRGDRTPAYLDHALSIFTLYLSLKAALRRQEEWALEDILVERECYDELLVPEKGRERRIAVRPDAVAVLRHRPSGLLWCLALESDKHNVRTHSFRQKAETLRVYVESRSFADAYPSVIGMTTLVVTGTQRRIASLSAAVSSAGAASFFLFTTRAAIGRGGFLAPIWLPAGGPSAHSPLPSADTLRRFSSAQLDEKVNEK